MIDSAYFDNCAERKKRAGRCIRSGCDNPPTKGFVTCLSCREKIYASRQRLKALRAAQAKKKTEIIIASLMERKHRIVTDGQNVFESLWDGHESLYALVEKWMAARA